MEFAVPAEAMDYKFRARCGPKGNLSRTLRAVGSTESTVLAIAPLLGFYEIRLAIVPCILDGRELLSHTHPNICLLHYSLKLHCLQALPGRRTHLCKSTVQHLSSDWNLWRGLQSILYKLNDAIPLLCSNHSWDKRCHGRLIRHHLSLNHELVGLPRLVVVLGPEASAHKACVVNNGRLQAMLPFPIGYQAISFIMCSAAAMKLHHRYQRKIGGLY